jgi:hypothetical protein
MESIESKVEERNDLIKGKIQSKKKWNKEHLRFAINLLDQKKTLQEAINTTVETFHVPPVSFQYLSKAYRKMCGNRKTEGTTNVSHDPTSNEPMPDILRDKDSYLLYVAKFLDRLANLVDYELSARTGNAIRARRYFNEALECIRIVGRGKGFIAEEADTQGTKLTFAIETEIKNKTAHEILAAVLPFAYNLNEVKPEFGPDEVIWPSLPAPTTAPDDKDTDVLEIEKEASNAGN